MVLLHFLGILLKKLNLNKVPSMVPATVSSQTLAIMLPLHFLN